MITVAIIGLVVGIAIPNYLKFRERAQQDLCIENLGKIQSAKQIWGFENNKADGDAVTFTDIVGPGNHLSKEPECPAGGVYTLNTVGPTPECTIPGHVL